MAAAISRSVRHQLGQIITVMFGRQMGKNETSAQLEAYLLTLYAHRGGSIVKAAPSFKPQTVNSILRLKDTLEHSPLTRNRWRPQFGYMMRLGDATISFLSADRRSSVVGATASLLLEIDEAQDVDPEKYDRDFRPMASSTNATTVLYGTAWAEDSLLQRQKLTNLELEQNTGEQLHFEFDWTVLGALNMHYRAFVEGEIARLGEQHPSIQTQYLLRCMSDAGRLFSTEQRRQLQGTHSRQRTGRDGATYVAGIDVAGEDEQAQDAIARQLSPKRDSTVITIGEVTRNDQGQPVARVVEHIWWTGRDQVWQYERLLEIWDQWHLTLASIDASGIGAGLAAFLASKHEERVDQYVFSQPSKSRLAYELLGVINTGRISLYQGDGSPEHTQCWQEIRATRYWLRANETIAWGVPETEGHDDFVTSLALCAHAAEQALPPAIGGMIRGPALPDDSERW